MVPLKRESIDINRQSEVSGASCDRVTSREMVEPRELVHDSWGTDLYNDMLGQIYFVLESLSGAEERSIEDGQ